MREGELLALRWRNVRLLVRASRERKELR